MEDSESIKHFCNDLIRSDRRPGSAIFDRYRFGSADQERLLIGRALGTAEKEQKSSIMFAQAAFCHNSHIFSKESLAFSTCHLALNEAYQVEEKKGF